MAGCIIVLTMAMRMTVAVFGLAAAPGLALAFASGRDWPTVADAAVVFRALSLALRGSPLALQGSLLSCGSEATLGSEALAMTLASCSWLALSRSVSVWLSRAICIWVALI